MPELRSDERFDDVDVARVRPMCAGIAFARQPAIGERTEGFAPARHDETVSAFGA